MTTADLADALTPKVRAAMELAKANVLDEYPVAKRLVLKAAWPLIMGVFSRCMTVVVIELLLNIYQRSLKTYVGPFIDVYLISIKDSRDERLAQVRDILSMLQRPDSQRLEIVKIVDPGGAI